ncbi:unnamed protein product [Darwinula stevensoni]|uniref:Uncharacterized protein n=1 Tax=Darwinula stevensoni TaxID=69355 RepID=A0A7R8X7P0_9CRUS|nr:unnamed protein product [Darwinula stevensoni]CAG0887230.1 unnamed protein product [Darwinula stevensoni]
MESVCSTSLHGDLRSLALRPLYLTSLRRKGDGRLQHEQEDLKQMEYIACKDLKATEDTGLHFECFIKEYGDDGRKKVQPNIQECIWKCDISEHNGGGCDGVNYNPEIGDCELVASGSSGLVPESGWSAYSSLHHRKYNMVVEWVKASRGEYPFGAFACGKTSSGEILYVGRTRKNNYFGPCKLQPSKAACFFPLGGGNPVDTYEVLVNLTMGYLDWVAASPVPTGALKGGRASNGEVLFICRAWLNQDHLHQNGDTCWVADGGSESAIKPYEVLVVKTAGLK